MPAPADDLGAWPDAQIAYFRTTPRWTQETEDRMVRAFRAGHLDVGVMSGNEDERLATLEVLKSGRGDAG